MAEKLVIKIDGDAKEFQSELGKVGESTKKLSGGMKTLAKGAAIAFTALGGAAAFAINEAKKIESMTTRFEVLTGSVKDATTLIKDLQKFSASTPFQLAGIAKAGQQLLGFGFSTQDVKQKLQEIGDVAAASGRPIEEISLIFGQVAAAGKLTGERLLQFQERAIPIGPAIAKTMGIAESSVKDMVSKGKVDFKTFEKAFASISQKGGKAFGGMAKQSETLEGKISTVKDNISLFAATMGKEMLPVVKLVADRFLGFIQRVQESGSALETFNTVLKATLKTGTFLTAAFDSLGTVIGAGLAVALESAKAALSLNFKQAKMIATEGAKGIAAELKANNKQLNQDLADIDESFLEKKKERKQEELESEVQHQVNMNEVKKELSLEQREELLGIEDENAEEDLERQILVDELKDNQELAKINKQIQNEEDKSAKLKLVRDRRAFIDQKREDTLIKRQVLTDKQKIEMDHKINKQLSDSAFTLASTLVATSGASAKKQFIIQKTLGIAQTLVNGYMASMLAQATIPPPAGQVVGAAALASGYVSAGLIAATGALEFNAQFADGGVFAGGIPGIDSIPALVQRNEIIAPTRSFDEVVEGTARQRGFTKDDDESIGGGAVAIHVSYDSPEASQIVTVTQVEDSALGISQDSFKEAV